MQQDWEDTRVTAIRGIRTKDQQLVPGGSRSGELWPLLKLNEMNLGRLLRHGGIKRRSVLGSPHPESGIVQSLETRRKLPSSRSQPSASPRSPDERLE